MITFLLGLTIGILVSIAAGAVYANKLEEEKKAKSADLEKALKDLFSLEDEPSAPVIKLVKDEDEDPEPIQ